MKFSTPILQSLQFQDFCVSDLNHRHVQGSTDLTQQRPVHSQDSGGPNPLHFLLKPPSLQDGSSWPHIPAHMPPSPLTHTYPPSLYPFLFHVLQA